MANNEAVLSGAVDKVTKRPSVQFLNLPPTEDDDPDSQQRQDTLTRSTSSTKDATGSLVEDKDERPLERTSSVSEEYMRYLDNTQNVEKRFPVDRRKLEELIKGRDNESAEDYFKRIQEETSTLILWPSRLKIGAKSKKDPQVKVLGLPASVQKARELILTDLDTKSSRVTLKIDIPCSEHSHVIGKEGANIKKVHSETKCHIHFPDSNRLYSGAEKSSQVSVTGEVTGVEAARKQIRGLVPLVMTFTLPLSGYVDANSPDLQQMMLAYSVNIHIKPQPRAFSVLVVIRGTVKQADGMKLAVNRVVQFILGDSHHVPMVSLSLDVSLQHHRTLIGNGGGNIRAIMERSNTTIQFPDPHARYRSNQVVVNGTVDTVLQARNELLGCLPVVLMFDIHESDKDVLSSSLIGELSQRHDVFISVKPKKGQLQSVIIKSIEQNIQWIYDARFKMLACSYQPGQQATPNITPTTDAQPVRHANGALPTISPISEEPTVEIGSTSPDQRSPSKSPEPRPGSSQDIRKELSPVPTETRPRTSSTPLGQNSATPHKMTPKRFLEYEKMREEAAIAMKKKVEPSEPRHPTHYWAGNYFSESMPAGPPGSRVQTQSPTSPRGLQSLTKRGYAELMRQASQERVQGLQAEQDLYKGVTDISSLLQQLGLEHYQERFEEEELDFDTFLTMSESDLKEIGVNTLGARRKIQIAISELKKVNGKTQQQPPPGVMSARGSLSLGRGLRLQNPPMGGFDRGGSLKLRPGGRFSMSQSGRF
ncbi:protein bicaudal C homolog 1-B-like isoform X2 [Halichondria panicea]|uniref:protein bicaudal C homolog 1-B-like isoform X2 n=1 Tax=Halichondria panicea TaxID=6063 RepID=UPI00312BA883